ETQPSNAPLPVVRGTLTDTNTGRPIPLARMRMTQRTEGRVYQTVTDSNGTYAFEQVARDGTYDLHPEPVEYITEDPWEPPRRSVELHTGRTLIKDYALEKGCKVELNAIDEEGHPVKGAEFHAVYVTNANGRGPKETVTTDSKGLAIICGLRPEAYLIVGAHRDYALAGERITFTESQEDLSLVIEMKMGLEVVGMATCSDGLPASGWRVEPKPAWWHSSISWPFDDPVSEDGTFAFRHIDPGLHRVVVSRPFGSGTISVWETEVDLSSKGGLLELAIPQPSSHSRASISGSIVFQGEAPTKGFSIYAFRKPGFHGRARWQPNESTFTISDLNPGSYDLDFTPPGGRQQFLRNIQAPGHDIILEIQTDTLIPILGQVVDKLTGQPVSDFQVRQINQETWRQCEDPNGFFTLAHVGSGLQQVIIRSRGYTDTLSDEITPGLTESLRIELEMPHVVHGKVIDSAGVPIEGVEINTRYQRSRNQSPDDMKITQSDGQGYFDLPLVLTNKTREWFVFRHPDYARVVQKLNLKEDPPEKLTVVMPRGGTIQGHLYDVAGKPMPDAPLYVMDENFYTYWKDNRGRLGMIFTDENGFFYMDHLPEDLCYFFRQDPDRQLGTVLSAILPKEGLTSTLNIGGPWRASGRLLHQGRALTNVRIMASFDYGVVQGFEAKTFTDGAGRFSFYGLPTGRRCLYVSPAGKDDWLALGEFDFVAGQDQNLGDWTATLSQVAVDLTHEDQALAGNGWDVQIRQYSEQSL
ncbi:MAG: carboxypeptidase regulatory-like domain-containing protein, partial [Phycisphaeraceae bacterium]|nr:carboxypeptidase regulatory-like domain-containing protein [Phycisphaeraceae bacterium]